MKKTGAFWEYNEKPIGVFVGVCIMRESKEGYSGNKPNPRGIFGNKENTKREEYLPHIKLFVLGLRFSALLCSALLGLGFGFLCLVPALALLFSHCSSSYVFYPLSLLLLRGVRVWCVYCSELQRSRRPKALQNRSHHCSCL